MRAAAGIAAIAFAIAWGGTASGAVETARLRLLDVSPIQVRGFGFKPAERVSVGLVLGDLKRTRVVSATQAGAFVVTFRGIAADSCSTFVVTARGGRGSGAVLRKRQLTECPEPVLGSDHG